MSKWKNHPTAPVEGAFVADAKNVFNKPTTLNVKSDKGIFPIIIMRSDSRILAYVNVCPHQHLPLDYRGNNLLSSDGNNLMCSAHGAMFDCNTGEGLTSGVLGCSLDEVPLSVDANGKITIGNNIRIQNTI